MKISNFKLKITQLISSKITFFVITSIIILGLNLTPLIAFILHSPTGRTFAMIHNNAQDFFFYQSLMNEGANGAWLTSDPYTSEPHQSSIIFSYFLWLGKLSTLFGLPYSLTYHVTRIVLSVFLLLTTYYLLLYLKIPHPRLTYLFFLFATPFMHKTADGSIVPYMNWWTGMDPIRRAAYLPHHMFGSLLLVLTIILFIKYFRQQKQQVLKDTLGEVTDLPAEASAQAGWAPPRWRYQVKPSRIYLLLLLLVPLLAFVHTPSLLIILLFLPPAVIIYIIQLHQDKKLHPTKSSGSVNLWGLSLYWFVGIIFLIIMITQTKTGFPWSQYIDWEKKLQFPLDKELIGAMGILFPFSIIGAIFSLKSKRFEYIFITCWLLIPYLLIPLAPKLNLSNIRLIQGVPYLPMAILAVLGIKIIEDFLKKFSIFNFQFSLNFQRLKIKKLNFISNFKFQISNLIILIIFIIFALFTYPTLQWSLKDQIREYWPIFGNVYFDNRLNNAFTFINQNFPNKTIVLSTFYTGNYLPAFTHTITYLGHFGYTYNVDRKQADSFKFFKNQMTEGEAKEFLTNNKINLIWQGPEEKPIYKDYLYLNLLKPVYDKEEVTLYRLNLLLF